MNKLRKIIIAQLLFRMKRMVFFLIMDVEFTCKGITEKSTKEAGGIVLGNPFIAYKDHIWLLKKMQR